MTLIVNGETKEIEADPDMPLLWALRDLLGIKGPKYGCGIAACGACTVWIDGVPTRSCVLPVSAVDGEVTTIEGLPAAMAALEAARAEAAAAEASGAAAAEAPAPQDAEAAPTAGDAGAEPEAQEGGALPAPAAAPPVPVLSAVQQAWEEEQVPQCGYCQAGQIMTAAALLRDIPAPSDEEIDAAMTNLCRCGTYPRIRRAIHRAAAAAQATDAAPAPAGQEG